MPPIQVWCRVTIVGPGGSELGTCELSGLGAPGLDVVETLAQLKLAAMRSGGAVVLHNPCTSLTELIGLVGLSVEMSGKPEDGEEAPRIEKGVEAADPTL
jgi:hypothetical protein